MSESPQSDPRLPQGAASDASIQDVHARLLHSRHEPKEGYSWMPLFMLGFVSTMIFVVSIYFIHHRGGFSPLVYDERFDPATMGDTGPKEAVDPRVAGKRHYNAGGSCVSCHQPNGQGLPPAFPPLAGSDWVTGSDERVIKILLHGLQGPVDVNGTTYNGLMPAFGPGSAYNWNDQKIAEVLTYIRSEWGNAAEPITAERVTEVRAQVGTRAQAWTAADLGQ
ncbi:MAG TPA: cytochrome c [Candidatus Synoicihabitans sp.]|nr:cytochrome c [Candidatus Synoicihabitans sp.]